MTQQTTLPTIPMHCEVADGQIVLVGADGTRLPALSAREALVLVNHLLAAIQPIDNGAYLAFIEGVYAAITQLVVERAALERLPADGRAN